MCFCAVAQADRASGAVLPPQRHVHRRDLRHRPALRPRPLPLPHPDRPRPRGQRRRANTSEPASRTSRPVTKSWSATRSCAAKAAPACPGECLLHRHRPQATPTVPAQPGRRFFPPVPRSLRPRRTDAPGCRRPHPHPRTDQLRGGRTARLLPDHRRGDHLQHRRRPARTIGPQGTDRLGRFRGRAAGGRRGGPPGSPRGAGLGLPAARLLQWFDLIGPAQKPAST
jgi:hypothetical protein